MKKHCFAIYIYILVLCVSMLGGCWQEAGSPTDTQSRLPIITDTEPPTESTGEGATVTVQYLPTKVHNPENFPVLKWVCVTDMYYGGKNRVWSEAAVHELNQMLADKDMPFRIQFVMLNHSEHTLYYDWTSEPVVLDAFKNADLIYANMTTAQMTEYLSPISEYVTGGEYPSLKDAVVHPLNWLQGTINGEVYAIPTLPCQAVTEGWFFQKTLLDIFGLQVSDFYRDFAEMDDLFAQMYIGNSNKPFLSTGKEGISYQNDFLSGMPNSYAPSIANSIAFQAHTIGSCFAIDYSTGTPKVVHSMELPKLREFQKAYMRYQESGYIVSADDTTLITYATGTDFVPNADERGIVSIPISTPVFNNAAPYGRVTGVAAFSENKEHAVKLLSLVASDKEFRMQLCYGKQGRDYTINEQGNYSINVREDGSCYSLDILSPHAYFSGLTSSPDGISYVSPSTNNWILPETSEYNKQEYYMQTLDRSIVRIPIVFDYVGLEKELADMQVLMEKYYPKFSNSTEIEDDPDTLEDEYVPVMDENGYEYVLQEFKKAGADTIIAELQRQLDAWLAKNPGWE